MKRAIIIGGTSGIGLEVARILHSEGWVIGIAGRRTELLNQIHVQFKERIYVLTIDVCQESAGDEMLKLIGQMGGVDLILNSSGYGKQNKSLEPHIEVDTMLTNTVGFTRIITTAYRYFSTQGGGHIAAISSIAGTKGLGAAPAYSATKRMQSQYIQCLAQKSRMDGVKITFTDIQPGFVDTDFIKGSNMPMMLSAEHTARCIVKALKHKRRKVIIDWKYTIIVGLWKLIPNWLWERLKISNGK